MSPQTRKPQFPHECHSKRSRGFRQKALSTDQRIFRINEPAILSLNNQSTISVFFWPRGGRSFDKMFEIKWREIGLCILERSRIVLFAKVGEQDGHVTYWQFPVGSSCLCVIAPSGFWVSLFTRLKFLGGRIGGRLF